MPGKNKKYPFLHLKIPIFHGFSGNIFLNYQKINSLAFKVKKSVFLYRIEARPALFVACDCKQPKR